MSDLATAPFHKSERSLPAAAESNTGQPLRLLSYNVQAGISTARYRHYLTHSWKHVLPHAQRFSNLDRIARLVKDYDIVGLQELDAGSLRSGYINLTEYLSEKAHMPFWTDQTNRRIGRFARHSTGVLSRFQPTEIIEHRLPGKIPGRGALFVRFGHRQDSLVVLILHMALGQRARLRQFDYISEIVNEYRHVIVMGDLNCPSQSAEMDYLINRTMMSEPIHGMCTFPSWRPQRNIDHILVTPTLQIDHVKVLSFSLSDHLPVEMQITLPESLHLGS
ncbi:MAG: endonuclease/exonuclease/phosphatase family protein [Gammaproteobacteria bacterium]|jgi:endonuclease/exonuclease/phosphatase family metal-dependent hydrolase|nr:endonuclease/exonuclease/phosphatase family protein [Gammaproteobacteria bacterium]